MQERICWFFGRLTLAELLRARGSQAVDLGIPLAASLRRGAGVRLAPVCVLALAASVAACAETGQKMPERVPVTVGGDQYDACPSIANQLDYGESGSIAVRSGPGDGYPVVDELHDLKGHCLYTA